MTTTTVIAQPKWIGKSTTFWGALIGVVAVGFKTVGPILDGLGVTVPVTEVDVQEAGNVGTNLITALGGLAGFGLAIWGRFKAGKVAQPITLAPNAPAKTIEVVKPGTVSQSKSTG